MKYDDVRCACLGLIKSRLHDAPGRPTKAAALGWQLQNADVAFDELATLCAAWIADPNGSHPQASPPHWRPSPLLRAFFSEYRRAYAASRQGQPKCGTPAAPRPRSHAIDRRTAGFSTH